MKLNKLFFLLATLAATLVACNPAPTPNDEPKDEDKLVLEDGTIVLNRCAGGIYFGDFWDEGIADYYFLLTNDDELGLTEAGFEVPMNPGRWLLFIDVWGALSEDHTNPIVPEGTYHWGEQRANGVLTSSFTLATENVEKVGEQYRIVDHYFSDGSLVVTHTEKGYKVEASFTTLEGEPMKFIFEGEMTLDDKSNDEEYNPELDDDVVVNPVIGRTYLYESLDNCDNHVLMLFSTNNLTDDKVHVAEAGVKLHLDLYNHPGAGLAGTYTVGEVNEVGILTEEPGVFYPGRMYGVAFALGSFLERVNEDMSVEFAVLEDGQVTITENADGTYTVEGEFVSGNETSISCSWTGVIVSHLE